MVFYVYVGRLSRRSCDVCRRLLFARHCMHRIFALSMQLLMSAALARWVVESGMRVRGCVPQTATAG